MGTYVFLAETVIVTVRACRPSVAVANSMVFVAEVVRGTAVPGIMYVTCCDVEVSTKKARRLEAMQYDGPSKEADDRPCATQPDMKWPGGKRDRHSRLLHQWWR